MSEKSIGLALSGGGSRGPYHIGVIDGLEQFGLYPKDFEAISGTSIGSMVGAMATYLSAKDMMQIWQGDTFSPETVLDISHDDLYNIPENRRQNAVMNHGVQNDPLRDGGILQAVREQVSEQTVREANPEFYAAVCRSKIKFNNNTLSWITGIALSDLVHLKINDLPMGKGGEAVLASCLMPIFKYVPLIDGKYYFDGGAKDVLPYNALRNHNLDLLITSDIIPSGKTRKIMDGSLQKPAPELIDVPRIHISPPDYLPGTVVDFHGPYDEQIYNQGREDALRALDKNQDYLL